VNYTLEEYANDVVFHLQRVCQDAGVAEPTILSESGRAVVAYHSVLVFNVLGVSTLGEDPVPERFDPPVEQPLVDLLETYHRANLRNALESYHDAQQAMDMALSLFNGGYLPLSQRCQGENLYWAILRKLRRLTDRMQHVTEELQSLDAQLSDTYYCNFSLFQSIPDCWAIKQLFPIVPIHRHLERPTRPAVLGDITCDSDGKIDQFIDLRDVKQTLPLHTLGSEPYYLAAFLVGAYQETLGDLHNLFGDTNAVHVSMDECGQAVVEQVVAGDTVGEVLRYVQFDPDALIRDVRHDVEAAIRRGYLSDQQAERLLRFYESGLRGYTYLGSQSS